MSRILPAGGYIHAKRVRQIEKWGGAEHDDQHSAEFMLAILVEEVGKLSATVVKQMPPSSIRDKAAEVGACALAFIEWCEKNP